MAGKFLWDVTVLQVRSELRATYTLTTPNNKPSFDKLAERAIALARKDDDRFDNSEVSVFVVIKIEANGTIDG